LASTKPARPVGARWWIMCCTQAKLRCAGRGTVLPTLVVAEEFAAPVAHVEGRVGEDVVGLEVWVAVVVEGVAVGDLAFYTADGEVHPGEAPGGIVGFLAVDAYVVEPAPVLGDELL
jgi:hypothetical protein